MTPIKMGRRKTDFVVESISAEAFYKDFKHLCETVKNIDLKLDKHITQSDAENVRIEKESKERDTNLKKELGWHKGIGAFVLTLLASLLGISWNK